MSIPIVESLDLAPEKGDAILQLTPAYDPDVMPNWCIPVRDRLPSWKIRSVAGWKTTAEIPPALRFEIPAGIGLFNPDPALWNFRTIVFAPTAEAAIEKYHASEACPFGQVTLHGTRFISHNTALIDFGWEEIVICDWINSASKVAAVHSLIGEIVVYQTAARAGTRDSRIHKALASS